MKENNLPLIIVFYIGRYIFETPEILEQMSLSVDDLIHQKGYNCMAFFLPTDGEERVECINPIQLNENEYKSIETLISDLKNNFDIKN